MQGFSLGAQVFLYRTTAKSSWKKADKFQTSLWTRLVPLISKWSMKVLHREISNRFNVAPHLTFLVFQSYIIFLLSQLCQLFMRLFTHKIEVWYFVSDSSDLSASLSHVRYSHNTETN